MHSNDWSARRPTKLNMTGAGPHEELLREEGAVLYDLDSPTRSTHSQPHASAPHAHHRLGTAASSDRANLLPGPSGGGGAMSGSAPPSPSLPLGGAGLGPAAPQPPKVSAAEATVFVIANVLVSVGIVLVNKLVLATFPRALILTLLHQAFCWASTRGLERAGLLSIPTGVPRRDAFIVGGALVMGLFFMNLSLSLNSVGVYQLTKMACLPTIGVLQTILFGAPVPSRPTLVALALVLLGVFLSTKHDFATNLAGLAAGVFAVGFTSLCQVTLQYMPSFKEVKGMKSVAVLAPYTTIVLLPLVLFVELPLMARSSESIVSQLVGAPWFLITVTCVLALAANYLGNTLIQKTSAITYNVVGHLKTILIVCAGAVMDPAANDLSALKIIGMTVSLGGMAIYAARSAFNRASESARAQGPAVYFAKQWRQHRGLLLGGFAFLVALAGFARLASPASYADQLDLDPNVRLVKVAALDGGVRDAGDLATQLWKVNDAVDGSAGDASIAWDRRRKQPGAVRGKERVLIMSSDSRPLQRLSEVNDDPMQLNFMTMSAVYNTWYALRHGYDYRRVQISSPKGWHGTWGKIKAIYDALHRYDLVVFLDGDAYMAQPDKSLPFLMERWGFHERASLLLAAEGPNQPHPNENGTNTGVWIARNTPLLKQSLRDIMDCPEAQGDHAWMGKLDIVERMNAILLRDHVRLYERFLFNGYHHADCTPWAKGTDERCTFAGED
ncbi:hypothetical protein H9P43_000816 [Blastocladiella emersonii ATCC 22665]|nr:hypothetical protein H9P43_000816 [Blastocladiella emersonii ATCC 22665]